MNKVTAFFQSNFWKRFGIGFVLLVLTGGFFLAGVITTSRAAKTDVDQTQQGVTDEEQQAIVDNRAQTIADVKTVSGADVSRKDSDDRLASSLFQYATTWDSEDSYAVSRSNLLRKFEYLDEDCMLLSQFFPPLESMITKDSSGNIMYNPFDYGINLQFVSMKTWVIAIDGDTYTYFGEVEVQSSGPYGGSATGHVATMYSTDKDGHIINPICYMVGV